MTAPDLTVGTDTGWVRFRLLPATQTAVTRVSVRCDQFGQGATINNARDLRRVGDQIRDWCHTTAAELQPGAPLEEQGALFGQETG